MFEYRLYRPGDEDAIRELFRIVFSRSMSADSWKWRYVRHPAGEANVMLAFSEGRLVGHYAAITAPLYMDGEAVPAALSVTTMTHPGYRGRGLFEKTALRLYDCLPEAGITAVYGFPNVAVHPLRCLKTGWHDIYEVPTLTLDLGSRPRSEPDTAVVEVERIDDRFGDLFRSISRSLPIVGARDSLTLSWRVDHNPDNRYTRLILCEGSAIAGYAITKSYGPDATDLVELRCADAGAARALISSVVARASAAGHRQVSTWCFPNEGHRSALESFGFRVGGPVTYFGGRSFRLLPRDFLDSRLWRLSMLDSDIY